MSQAGIVDFEGSHPQVPTAFVTNMGTAIPIANVLEILGTTVAAHGIPLETTGSGNTVTIVAQYASAAATSLATNAGFSSFNSSQFTVDANGYVSLSGTGAAETITGNTGGPLSPVAGNWNILGVSTAPGAIPVQTSGSGNTLTVQVQKAQAIASTNATNVGLAAFNSANFTVDANGFVSLIASSEVAAFTVDANTAPGTNPVLPNGSGIVTVTGGQVVAGTTANVIRTISLAANSYTVQIQRSQAVASSTIGDNGVSHFNSAFFTVDSNGFVSLNGSAVGETITGNVGGALSPTAGNWNILGSSTAAGTTPVQTAGSGSTLTVQVQKAQAIASTNATNVGLAAFNSAQFTVDANGFVALSGTGSGQTITGNTGGALSPTAGNWNIVGNNTALNGFATYTTGATSTLTVNSFGRNKWVVNPVSGIGTHTTIQAAVTAASSGDTVVVTANSSAYTENITLKAGVNIVADTADAFTPNVTIAGTITHNTAGTVSISGIRLQTNNNFLLAVTGSAASIVNLNNCYLNCTNNTGISYTSSSSSSIINCYNCITDCTTTGIGLFTATSSGNLVFRYTVMFNSGGTSTASTTSACMVFLDYGQILIPFSCSSSGSIGGNNTFINCAGLNTTTITTAGTGLSSFFCCSFASGTASAISIGSGTTVVLNTTNVSSSNTNAITGAGTLVYTPINFTGSSSTVNTTTQTVNQIGPKIYAAGGISFDGSNYLSNYAVGTFTPTVIGGTTAGTTTYGTQSGVYTRIGNTVYIIGVVTGSAATGTGNITYGALPFTVKNQTPNPYGNISFISARAFPTLTTTVSMLGVINTTQAIVAAMGTSVGQSAVQMANQGFNDQYTLVYQI